LPLKITGGPVNLRQPESVAAVLDFVRQAEQEFDMACSAIFIDTLNCAMAGGDENTSEDMGALVAGAHALRLATGAAIVLVHHLGKDEGRGARGHSSLFAAFDTEMTVTKQNDMHVMKVTKQREYPPGGIYAFRLNQVGVGLDDDHELVTTCLVKPEDNATSVPEIKVGGKLQVRFLAALSEWRRTNPDKPVISTIELAALAEAQGFDRFQRRDLVAAFTEKKVLQPSVGGHVLTLNPEA
jgi:hypothetical protein